MFVDMSFLNCLSTLILLFACCTAQTASSNSPIVDLGYVKYSGYSNSTAGINYFRGIPYAQPPLGQLRWQKPRPIESKNDFAGQTIDATQKAPFCYQSLPFWFFSSPRLAADNVPVTASEDCLILDVLVPSSPASSSLPVLVQIHGGGYVIGSAQSNPGDALVNASNGNVIYVAIQYRLGMFGFLGGSEIAENGALNAGLLDQRAALEWVQRNIRAFGGDPARVTITGGSAGGGSVTLQLIAGGASDEPPFSAAIAEYPWWQPLLNASSQERQYRTALTLSGCSDINCLRSLSSDRLVTLNQQDQNSSYPAPGNGYGSFWFGPVVDGTFVRNLPDQEFKLGHFYNVPVIVDHDQYEGVLFSNATQTSTMDETMDAENLFPFGGPSFFSRLYQLYPRSSYNSTFFQRQSWFGDFIINCPTYQMATGYADNPNSANSSQIFKLIFAAGSELHGATGSFLWSNTTSYPSANNQTIAEIITSYWISFVQTYDPNPLRSSNAPFWPSYSAPASGAEESVDIAFNVLDITYSSIETVQDPDAGPQCDFFSSRGYVVRN